jgi:hypothetical protein
MTAATTSTPEVPATLAEVVGDLPTPEIGSQMLRTWIELPDSSYLWLRVSRRRKKDA